MQPVLQLLKPIIIIVYNELYHSTVYFFFIADAMFIMQWEII